MQIPRIGNTVRNRRPSAAQHDRRRFLGSKAGRRNRRARSFPAAPQKGVSRSSWRLANGGAVRGSPCSSEVPTGTSVRGRMAAGNSKENWIGNRYLAPDSGCCRAQFFCMRFYDAARSGHCRAGVRLGRNRKRFDCSRPRRLPRPVFPAGGRARRRRPDREVVTFMLNLWILSIFSEKESPNAARDDGCF